MITPACMALFHLCRALVSFTTSFALYRLSYLTIEVEWMTISRFEKRLEQTVSLFVFVR
jgi:hypothetical protein